MSYDFLSCESHESAIKKLSDYHNLNCSGYINCRNCYYYDEFEQDAMKADSKCRKYCDECMENNDVYEKCCQEEYCSKCKYCGKCEKCVVKKCENCDIYCSKCNFNGKLSDFSIMCYNKGELKIKTIVKIFMMDKEIERYNIY